MLNNNYWNQNSLQWLYLPLLILFISFAGETKAARFELSFEMSTGTMLDMNLQGILQADNNSVVVTDIDTVKVDDVAQSLQNSDFGSVTFFNTGIASPTLLSLNGSILDFVFCLNGSCLDSAFLDNAFAFLSFSGFTGTGIYEDIPGNFTSLNSQNYSLVPEPHVLSLLLIGFVLVRQNSRELRKN